MRLQPGNKLRSCPGNIQLDKFISWLGSEIFFKTDVSKTAMLPWQRHNLFENLRNFHIYSFHIYQKTTPENKVSLQMKLVFFPEF